MKNNDIIRLAHQVLHLLIAWGVGGFLIIFGCITMALGKKWFGLNWPDFLMEGVIEILLGMLLVIIMSVIETPRKGKTKNGKNKKSY